jgi:hypothetical protein
VGQIYFGVDNHLGELPHIDIKKRGRFDRVGHRTPATARSERRVRWEYVFVAVDDHSRIAFTRIYLGNPATVPRRSYAPP